MEMFLCSTVFVVNSVYCTNYYKLLYKVAVFFDRHKIAVMCIFLCIFGAILLEQFSNVVST